ncbi:MAG TPA: DUF4328 domain-containing protein [Mycobacteriales bacterium]|nr:DUF4328 domain-containing protein [Mycobacteriales bacterium]
MRRDLKLDRWLTPAVVAGLTGCGATAVWLFVVDVGQARYAADLGLRQKMLDYGQGRGWDHRVTVAGGVSFLVLLLTGALFITWHFRVLRRIERVLPDPLRHSPYWAIGGWFVPLLNLVRPKQMVNDAWRGTASTASTAGLSPRIPLYVHLWWAFWLLSSAVTGVAGHLSRTTLRDLASADEIAAAGDVLTLVAAGLAIAVVIGLDRRSALVPEPTPLVAMPGMLVFNPPPGWPAQPPGWQPPTDWEPDPSWPPVPPGWKLWVPRHERWLGGLNAMQEPQNRGGSK